ncbi:MAG: Zn-ribbon domain-containing OB-fold protein, partial [Acidimicrobiia bacterium]
AEYSWDTGVAIGGYLEGLQEGKILGRLCYECRRKLVPPRMFCEQCFRPTDEWVEVGDTGIINTFSLCYVTWDMQPLKIPEIPAVIELDGASKGIGIMHKIGGAEPDDIRIGMNVKAVWKPANERVGSILDIRYFQPVDARPPRATKRATKSKAKAPARPKPKTGKKRAARRARTGAV